LFQNNTCNYSHTVHAKEKHTVKHKRQQNKEEKGIIVGRNKIHKVRTRKLYFNINDKQNKKCHEKK